MTTLETPSKVAAAALSTIDLNKPTEGSLLAKLKAAAATAEATKAAAAPAETKAEADAEESEEVEAWRKRFVGDVDCEEKDEPLLAETTARFVLFPIKYREVSLIP